MLSKGRLFLLAPPIIRPFSVRHNGRCVINEKASTYFPTYTDYLIEIGLTANRGDATSHKGVARDLRALTNIPLYCTNLYVLL